MNEPDARCQSRVQTTADALNPDIVAFMLLAMRGDNVRLNVHVALERCDVKVAPGKYSPTKQEFEVRDFYPKSAGPVVTKGEHHELPMVSAGHRYLCILSLFMPLIQGGMCPLQVPERVLPASNRLISGFTVVIIIMRFTQVTYLNLLLDLMATLQQTYEAFSTSNLIDGVNRWLAAHPNPTLKEIDEFINPFHGKCGQLLEQSSQCKKLNWSMEVLRISTGGKILGSCTCHGA
ncbi:hypothetical protein B0H13DRAFT_1906709 [Mycena leptocephala]|nr:hypothetical protein B0H13DRAFT_1906709 [Mycena leptocephala]